MFMHVLSVACAVLLIKNFSVKDDCASDSAGTRTFCCCSAFLINLIHCLICTNAQHLISYFNLTNVLIHVWKTQCEGISKEKTLSTDAQCDSYCNQKTCKTQMHCVTIMLIAILIWGFDSSTTLRLSWWLLPKQQKSKLQSIMYAFLPQLWAHEH